MTLKILNSAKTASPAFLVQVVQMAKVLMAQDILWSTPAENLHQVAVEGATVQVGRLERVVSS